MLNKEERIMKKTVLAVLVLLMAFSMLYAGGKKEVKAESSKGSAFSNYFTSCP